MNAKDKQSNMNAKTISYHNLYFILKISVHHLTERLFITCAFFLIKIAFKLFLVKRQSMYLNSMMYLIVVSSNPKQTQLLAWRFLIFYLTSMQSLYRTEHNVFWLSLNSNENINTKPIHLFHVIQYSLIYFYFDVMIDLILSIDTL